MSRSSTQVCIAWMKAQSGPFSHHCFAQSVQFVCLENKNKKINRMTQAMNRIASRMIFSRRKEESYLSELIFFPTLFTHMSTYIISLHKPNIGLCNYILYIYNIFFYTLCIHIYVSSLSSFINNQLREYQFI